MFANRYTALIDACCLASALKRNLLLTLAEAEFFRPRWSVKILDETERAITRILSDDVESAAKAKSARASIERAFPEADVDDYSKYLPACNELPDKDDKHVLAAALAARAATIVTDNIKHFPGIVLSQFQLEAKTADSFIADAIALDHGKAVTAIRKMRLRFNRPALGAEQLLLIMEARSLFETASTLRSYVSLM